MKKITLALLLFSALFTANAQIPFTTTQSMDINNIKAASLVHGDMWWDPSIGLARCEYPINSGKNFGGASSLWISGYDAQSNLHVAAQTYRQNGNDYWPGPIDSSTSTTQKYANSQKWACIWKVNKTQIDSFLSLSTHTTANTPKPILKWPGKGNPYATGNNNVALIINQNMAPFVDVNNDGVYNPLNGDYPVMKGDQMMWWIINDNGATHNESAGLPLNVEIQNLAYAYKRGSLIDNVIYYEYNITNKAATNYIQLRMGLSADLDLGYGFDDFIGFDSSRRLGIVYNARDTDGNGEATSYGTAIPAAGVTFIQLPGDAANAVVPAGCFNYYNNDNTNNGNPQAAIEFDNLLRGKNRAGIAFPGNSKYIFKERSECDLVHVMGDRRFVITTNDLSFQTNETKKIVMALIISPNAGGCPNIDFTGLHNVSDTAWNIYNHPLPVTGITAIQNTARSLRIYPNPATQNLFVETERNDMDAMANIRVYDAVGRVLTPPMISQNGKVEMNVSTLATGIYTIVYRNGDMVKNNVFVKQ